MRARVTLVAAVVVVRRPAPEPEECREHSRREAAARSSDTDRARVSTRALFFALAADGRPARGRGGALREGRGIPGRTLRRAREAGVRTVFGLAGVSCRERVGSGCEPHPDPARFILRSVQPGFSTIARHVAPRSAAFDADPLSGSGSRLSRRPGASPAATRRPPDRPPEIAPHADAQPRSTPRPFTDRHSPPPGARHDGLARRVGIAYVEETQRRSAVAMRSGARML